jgi:N utilization substance protein B
MSGSARPAGRGGRRANGPAQLGAARLAAVQALYQGELRKADAESLVAEFRRHRLGEDIEGEPAIPPDEELFADIVRGVAERQATLDAMIAELLPANWPFARLEVILRCILRAGAYELASRLSTPARVVIDEYMEVGHAFFSGAEPKMINGILDRLARKLRPGELERDGGGRQAPR